MRASAIEENNYNGLAIGYFKGVSKEIAHNVAAQSPIIWGSSSSARDLLSFPLYNLDPCTRKLGLVPQQPFGLFI